MTIRDTSAQDHRVADTRVQGRRRRHWLIAASAGALALGGGAWLLSSWAAGSASVSNERLRIAEVKRGDLVRDIAADGRVIAANSPVLYAIAGGSVDLKVVAGDVVKKGQVLAEIDSPELRSKLAQEQATLASLEAEASRAELDGELARSTAQKLLDQAQIDRVAAQRDLERYQRAFDGGAVAKVDVAKAQDDLKKADIGLSHARDDIGRQGRSASLDARNKRLLADRQRAIAVEAQRQVDALTLRAPFDGQVGQVQVAQRANVAINDPVLSVVDLSVFEVEIKVPESFARDLAIGIPAQITSGTGEPFAAQISAVSPEVVAGEVVSRLRFKDKQPPGLRQNQRLSARIVLDTRRNALMVERGPFLEQSGGTSAYVVVDGVATRRPIRTGVSSLSNVEILEGLQPGERIVVSGSDQFANAQSVRISGE
ncbi:efflux RND transporter periplasmic adaptor subunit [Pseudomonas sp. CGJS7]|uniref:efflux RND transporter periplasmic adaptor subunit n=1 Tax=Pseudomonas sp. CGJS7 TaxID=3109348 RepID=UPI003008C142